MKNEHTPLPELPGFAPVSPAQAAPYCATSVAIILATDMRKVPVKIVLPGEEEAATQARLEAASKEPVPRPLQLFEGKALLAHVLQNVAPCFPKTFVLVREGMEELQAAAGLAGAGAAAMGSGAGTGMQTPQVEFVQLDYEAELAITAEGCGFDLMTLTKGRLTSIFDATRTYAASLPEDAPQPDSVCIFNADQPLIAPRHIKFLQEEFRGMPHPESCDAQAGGPLPLPVHEVAASWIEWRRALPVAISLPCLQRLCAPGFPGLRPGGQPALASIQLHDVRFGEEKLNGYLVLPEANDEWLERFTLSMPQTLQKARALRALLEESGLPISVLDDDFDPATLGSSASASASASEGVGSDANEDALAAFAKLAAFKPYREQLEYALRVLDQIEKATNGPEFADRSKWNAWAARNRLDFPLLNSAEFKDRLVYLDSAATAQRPNCVMRAQEEHETHANANIWRGYYKLANDCTKAFEGARAQIAAFIGAQPGSLFFTQNTTGALNMVAQIWGRQQISAGDLIVCGISEHHSNMLPWFLLRDQLGARVEFIPYTPDGRYDLAAYEQLLAQGPKLVSFALVGNTLGIMAPAARMAQMAHDAGARVCVDAAQALAHLPIDVAELGCDFLAFSSHKAYGPMGIGGLYVSPDALAECEPANLGGGTVSNVTEEGYYLRFAPAAFEAGTPPITQAIGLAKAVEYLGALGMDNVHAHARALSRYAMAALCALPGVTVMGDHTGEDGALGSISFHVANLNCLNASKSLGELGVAVRGGAHCAMPLAAHLGTVGSLRVSLGVYNTFDDIDALVLALSHVIDHFTGIEPRP